MILQPIVENAINYGIKPYRKRGELEIEVVRVQDILCIRVKDSGLGLKAGAAEDGAGIAVFGVNCNVNFWELA